MGKQYICGGSAYELAGAQDDVIGLPVSLKEIPETIVAEGVELVRRPAFHVSLVCMGRIGAAAYVADIVRDFCEYVAEHPITLEAFTGEFRFVTEGEKRTLVAMCTVSNIEGFFEHIRSTYGLAVEAPPTHVTLYTLGGGPGVFLTSQKDISELTVKVEPPQDLHLV